MNHNVLIKLIVLLVAGFGVASIKNARAASVVLQNATATYSQTFNGDFSVNRAINGTAADGLAWSVAHFTEDLGTEGGTFSEIGVFETASNVGFSTGSLLNFSIVQTFGAQHTIGRFRLSLTTDDRSLFADNLINGGDVTANWIMLDPNSFSSANGATLSKLGDSSILASGFSPNTDTYTVAALTTLTGITGIRLELLEDLSLPFHGPGRQPQNGNLGISEFTVDIVQVPEPSAALITIILGGVWYVTRRAFKP